MKTLSAEIAFVLFATIFFSACGSFETTQNSSSANTTAQNAAQSSVVKDDIEELRQIINFPYTPEEVVWQESVPSSIDKGIQASASNEKKIIAVLEFTSEDANRLIEQSAKFAPANPAVVDAESWFPAELIAQSELSGDGTLKGNSFAADDFFLAPFIKGTITHISNTNFFILELATL